MTSESNGNAQKISDYLDRIFNLWTDISHEGDKEFHGPANIGEVEESWRLIKKIDKLGIVDEDQKQRLGELREILESFGENAKAASNYDLAWQKLNEVYEAWTNISYDDEQEFRSPDSRKEIKKSRHLIKEVKELDVDDNDIRDRIEELEEVVDSIDTKIPNNRGKMVRSIVFSLLIISALVFVSSINTFKTPDFQYDAKQFVTVKSGYMFFKAFRSDDELADVKQKIHLRKKTQLKPVARTGTTGWFQVETDDGQRGFVKNNLLKGMRLAEASAKVNIFDKVGAKKHDTISRGTKVTVLERKKWRIYSNNILFIKIKLKDGRKKWAMEKYFDYPIFNGIPDINESFFYRVNRDDAEKTILGKQITEIEKRYGPASSILKVNDTLKAYFRQLVVVDGKKDHKGLTVFLDDNKEAQAIKISEHGKGRFYNLFPLVSKLRKLEPNKIFNYSFYNDNEIRFQWWEDFREINWISRILAWLVKWVLRAVIFILVFLVPWAVASPVINSFAFSTRFSNETLKLISVPVYLVFAYIFFAFMILIMDQWLIPALLTLLCLGIWSSFYLMNLEYVRCPNCNTMYSALDKGSTFKGQSTSSTLGTYNVDKGTTSEVSSLGEGRTLTTTTRHYERRDKKTTTTVRRYLDHRTCYRCGYEWDISRTETEEQTDYY